MANIFPQNKVIVDTYFKYRLYLSDFDVVQISEHGIAQNREVCAFKFLYFAREILARGQDPDQQGELICSKQNILNYIKTMNLYGEQGNRRITQIFSFLFINGPCDMTKACLVIYYAGEIAARALKDLHYGTLYGARRLCSIFLDDLFGERLMELGGWGSLQLRPAATQGSIGQSSLDARKESIKHHRITTPELLITCIKMRLERLGSMGKEMDILRGVDAQFNVLKNTNYDKLPVFQQLIAYSKLIEYIKEHITSQV